MTMSKSMMYLVKAIGVLLALLLILLIAPRVFAHEIYVVEKEGKYGCFHLNSSTGPIVGMKREMTHMVFYVDHGGPYYNMGPKFTWNKYDEIRMMAPMHDKLHYWNKALAYQRTGNR